MAASTEGMRRPKQARSQDSTDKMLDAALEILSRDGVRGLTITAVSKLSGSSNGSLYHRFGDRHGLLIAAQARFLSGVESTWTSRSGPIWDSPDLDTLVTRLVDAFLDIFEAHRKLFQAFMITSYDDPALRARGTDTSRSAAAAVAQLLVERAGCTPEAADTAFRVLYAQAVLVVVFSDEEVTATAVGAGERRRHLFHAVRAVLRS
ncbi:TetR/AcrR family transcriptional regulator [Nocardia sp. NPDC050712]|uniref:TetR/AcrR family transcriptional regulator n=1 Tax=Nocardia sp. NPDC050712 TaxID=3155518 RepID=UPI0033C23F45